MRFIKKTDLIIIAGLLIIAGTFFVVNSLRTNDVAAKAEIYLESELIKTVSLQDKREEVFSVKERPHVVFHLYEDGSIAFEESDCPDKVCINSGRLHIKGQSAACLPNRLHCTIVPVGGKSYNGNDVVI